MSFLDDEQLETEALTFRERFGFSPTEPISWDALLRGAEKAFPGLRIISAPDEEMMRAAGEADSGQNRIRLRQTVYQRLKSGCEYALEVLVHELCHFHLGHKEVRYRSLVKEHSARASKDEPQAHLLARAILAPADIAASSSIEHLVSMFHMDKNSAQKRKYIAERMMARRNNTARQLPQGVIDFLSEARARGHKVTSIPE